MGVRIPNRSCCDRNAASFLSFYERIGISRPAFKRLKGKVRAEVTEEEVQAQ